MAAERHEARGQLVGGLVGLALCPLRQKGKPPAVGSKKHPPLEDAPGTYVLREEMRFAAEKSVAYTSWWLWQGSNLHP